MPKNLPEKCELCHDPKTGEPEEMYLHARCHMSAPLQMSLKDGVLVVRCYIPECSRVVAQFRVSERLS